MNTWTVTDFITYIYQLVADADFETDQNEINIVKKQVGEILKKHFNISTYSYEVSLTKIQCTEGVSLINCMDVIRRLMPQFEMTKEAKQDILEDLNVLAMSNNSFTHAEQEIIRLIKEVFMTVQMPLSW